MLFAAIAAFFVGGHGEIVALLALLGALTMLLHIVLGLILSATDLFESAER